MTLTEVTDEDATMTRGGKPRDRDGPERRCIATGESGPVDRLVRFVLSPDGHAVPDVAGKLPGRGAWLTADRALVDKAVAKRLFARAFRQPVEVDPGLADLLESLLARRMIDTISLARKAGQAVTGAEKVRAKIQSGEAAVLLQAADGSPDGKQKLQALARATGGAEIVQIELLSSAELGLAFGREFAIHAALDAGGFAARLGAEAKRLSGLRSQAGRPDGSTGDDLNRHGTETVPGLAGKDDSRGPDGGSRDKDDT